MYFKNRMEFDKRIKQNKELSNATYGLNYQDSLNNLNNVSAYQIEDINVIHSDNEHYLLEYKISVAWYHKNVQIGSVINDMSSIGFNVSVINEKNVDSDFYFTEFNGWVRSTEGW